MTTPPTLVPSERTVRLMTAVIGIVLVTVVCVAMRPVGTLAALVVLYLGGLAIVLRTLVPPAA